MAKSNMGLRKITFTIILLCVVRSFVAEKNVAVGKPSQQSSKYNDVWLAKNVVDGCVNTSIWSGCCTHTNTRYSSGGLAKTVWWRVNLEQMMTINRITIYYSEKFHTRLAGYELYVSNSTSSPQDGTLCFTDTSSTSSSVQLIVTHQCPYVGQYVTVYNYRNSNKRQPWYSNDAVLILCEVQVWGCPAGKLGDTCETDCPSVCYGGNCNSSTAACFYCFNGKFGEFCNQTCSTGCKDRSCEKRTGHCYDCVAQKYGPTCDQDCSINCQNRLCNRNDGHCFDCISGWYGDMCNKKCSHNCNGTSCDRTTGNCFGCVSGTYGDICENSCSMNCSGMFCDQSSGSCLLGCVPKQYGETCDLRCSSNCNGTTCGRNNGYCLGCIAGKHGNACDRNCPSNCKDMLCGKDTGNCIECALGKHGVSCDQDCPVNCRDGCTRNNATCIGCRNGRYDVTCTSTCPVTCKDFVCDQQTGHCLDCYPGKYGVVCGADCPDSCTNNICNKADEQCLTQDSSNSDQQSSVDPNMIVIAVLAVVCGLLIVAWIITYMYLRRNKDSGNNSPDKTTEQSGPDTGYSSIDRRDVEPAHVYEMVVT